MTDLISQLIDAIGIGSVMSGSEIEADYSHDEALTVAPVYPAVVVKPTNIDQVRDVIRIANLHEVAITPRGAGTGLSGGAVPTEQSIVVALSAMNTILDIDTDNHVAVVEAGVTLAQLDEVLKPLGLEYPVFPGEYSATIGGNIATNAGGMRAVRHGVTRHNVLGLKAVLANGEVITTGGRFVKSSSGYDLTQLIIGSEGTLAVVTEATLRLRPRARFTTAILAPFSHLSAITSVVPVAVTSGLDPVILEYIDALAIEATAARLDGGLGIPQDIRASAQAYLFVYLEENNQPRLDEDIASLATLLMDKGAMDCFVLPSPSSQQFLEAREQAFWVAKANGVNDIVDIVVPRASLPEFMISIEKLASEHCAWIAGAGHAGDGNIHLAVFLTDDQRRHDLLELIMGSGLRLGGAISAEHGIGREKRSFFLKLEDPVKLELMRGIKAVFDPKKILNPGVLL